METYNPSHLLDLIARKLAARHDLHLARIIGVNPSMISKIRTGRSPISAAFLVRVNELTGVEIEALRSAMGDRRKFFRISEVYLPKYQTQNITSESEHRRLAH